MFSKKSPDEELRVEYETDRMAYRVVPDKNDPVILHANNTLLRVVDISAGGVSCVAENLKIGERYPARVNLPDGFIDLRCDLEVLSNDDGTIYHCRFQDMDDSDADRLHRYVLERQKVAIKSVREKIK